MAGTKTHIQSHTLSSIQFVLGAALRRKTTTANIFKSPFITSRACRRLDDGRVCDRKSVHTQRANDGVRKSRQRSAAECVACGCCLSYGATLADLALGARCPVRFSGRSRPYLNCAAHSIHSHISTCIQIRTTPKPWRTHRASYYLHMYPLIMTECAHAQKQMRHTRENGIKNHSNMLLWTHAQTHVWFGLSCLLIGQHNRCGKMLCLNAKCVA